MRLPNGYGSIFKLKGNLRKKWRVCLPATYEIVEGKLKKSQKVLGNFATRQEAIKQLESYHLKKDNGIEIDITFSVAYKKWFEVKSKTTGKGWTTNTKGRYKYLSPLYDKPVNDITLAEMQNIFNKLTVGEDAQKKIKTILSNVFDYSIINGWATKNMAKYIVVAKDEIKENKHYNYTIEEIKSLWEDTSKWSVRLQLLLIYTGLRFGELFNITEYHTDERYFVTGSKTDAGRNRKVPIHQKILPFLLEMKDKNLKSDSYLRRVFEEYSNGHTPHDCRYTFAWLMEKAGVPLLTTQKIMGHKSGNVTQDIYTNLYLDEMIEAIDKIENCLY